MNSDHRALLEYVANVVDEQLHDLDPLRVQGRVRLRAMLKRCAQTREHDFAFVPRGYLRQAAP
jgi:hypothetical protein